MAAVNVRISYEMAYRKAVGCPIRQCHYLWLLRPPFHFLCICGCVGGMWDMCARSGWYWVAGYWGVFTGVEHVRSHPRRCERSCSHPRRGHRPTKATTILHTRVRDVPGAGHHTHHLGHSGSSIHSCSQGMFLNNYHQRK